MGSTVVTGSDLNAAYLEQEGSKSCDIWSFKEHRII
jgi:hypothetical protein